MSFDRSPWRAEFSKTGGLPWLCPSCSRAPLALLANSLQEGQTSESLEQQKQLASEPEWIDGRFSCLFECSHCSHIVAVAGTWRVEDQRHYDEIRGEVGGYVEFYRPLFFTDSPHIIPLPETTPERVEVEIVKSFNLFWTDLEACGNRVRRAVEEVLTQQRIPRWSIGRAGSRKGKRQRLSLHDRIVAFIDKDSSLSDALMAVKWIGNAASHPEVLSIDDLLDGYELLGYVLDELYVRRAQRVSALARAVNRRRGPVGRRRQL